MELSCAALAPRERYALLTSLIVPRPIAWVSTKTAAGHTNLAPFSYFTGLGSDPAMITLGIAQRRDGSDKDTLRIAKETGVFCVNLVEEHDAAVMNQSSGEHPPDVSEPALLSIATAPCVAIDGVRVDSARAALECRLVDVHRYGARVPVNLVVAEVLHIYVADTLYDAERGAASPAALAPVARLGGGDYARLGERFTLERPQVGPPRAPKP